MPKQQGQNSDVSKMTKLTIDSTITAIKQNDFLNYTSLLSITIPNSVTSIDQNVFKGCPTLKQLNISKAFLIKDYPDVEAFRKHLGLSTFCNIIAAEELENATVYTCVNGKDLNNPQPTFDINNAEEIAENQFKDNTQIRAIRINDNVKTIKSSAFYGCTDLEAIHIPSKIKVVPQRAFAICPKLKRVSISEGVETLDMVAFYNCTSLKNITIPNTVKNINYGAFAGCTALESITIPNSVTKLGAAIFEGCTSLKKIVVSSELLNQYVNYDEFKQKLHLNPTCEIIVQPQAVIKQQQAQQLQQTQQIIDSKFVQQEQPVVKPIQKPKEIVDHNVNLQDKNPLPQLLKPIAPTKETHEPLPKNKNLVVNSPTIGYTFSKDKEDFVSLEIGSSVRTLVYGAFSNFKNLKDVIIEEGVETIGQYAFFGCENIPSIQIPKTVTTLGLCAFKNCTSLKSIVLPNSVTNLGEQIFEGCTSLKEIVVSSELLNQYRNQDEFKQKLCLNSDCKITIQPQAVIEQQQIVQQVQPLAQPIKSTHEIVPLAKLVDNKPVPVQQVQPSIPQQTVINYKGGSKALPSGTPIADYMFSNTKDISSVKIGSDVKTIGKQAFSNSSLASISVPSSVETIPFATFAQCSSLSNVELAHGIKTIGKQAFQECTVLKSVNIPESVTTIERAAFHKCGITSIKIPSSVETIQFGTFVQCSSLSNVELADGVKTIEQLAFFRCDALKSISIPNSIKKIEKDAFAGCFNLKEFKIDENIMKNLERRKINEDDFKQIVGLSQDCKIIRTVNPKRVPVEQNDFINGSKTTQLTQSKLNQTFIKLPNGLKK